jgi:hypothetical protein
MSLVGYILALIGIYGLYNGDLILGGIIFFVGGFFAKKLFFSIRSSGVMTMALSIAYGYHNEYSPTILFLIFIGFVLACFNSKRESRDDGWGIDFDFSSLGSNSHSDGDGGGDCGGD